MVAATTSRPSSSAIRSVMPVRATSYAQIFETAVPTTPGNRASPPVLLMPTTRPCLLAWVPSGTTTCRSVIRSTDSTQSPAAQAPPTLVSMRESVTMPPVSPIAMPPSRAMPLFGRTPVPRITMSAGSVRSVVCTARTVPPSPSKPSTDSLMYIVTPTARNASVTSAAMSSSRVAAMGCSVRSTSVTSRPQRTRASAISSPTYPPPTTTARRGLCSSMARRTATPSASVCTPKIPSASTPGTSGRKGTAPVATTSWSNGSSRSPSPSRTRTRRQFTSIALRRCSSGVRATSSSTSVTRSPTKYGMPHAEYEVYGPRSKATISRSSGSRRRRARDAAVMPAASPPMTTSRSVTPRRGSRRRLCPQAAERLDHGFGLGHEPPHEFPRRHEGVDGARPLPGRVALAVGVDAGGLVAAGEVQRPLLHRLEDLLRERLELLGVLVVVLRGLVAHRAQRLAGERPADDGVVLGGADQRLLVPGRRARLGRGDETRADPRAVGTQRERRRQPPPVEEPAGGDDRHPVADRVHHLGHERHRGHGAGVAAGFGALGDDDVAARLDGGGRVANLPAHVDHEHVVVMAEPDDVARHAEAGHEHLRAFADHELDVRHHLLGKRSEEVDTERLARRRLHGADLVDHLVLGHGRRAQATEAARFGHRGDERVVRDATHAGEHHRMLDLQGIGQSSSHVVTLPWRTCRTRSSV